MLPAGDFPALPTGGPTGTVRDAMPGWDPGVPGGNFERFPWRKHR